MSRSHYKAIHRFILPYHMPYSGFVCEVQICTNSVRCCGLTDFSLTVMLLHVPLLATQVIAACVTVPCLVIWLIYVSLQVLQEGSYRYFDSTLLQCLIQKMLMHFFHHGDSTVLLQCNSMKHPCKCSILWSYIYSLLYRILFQMPLHVHDRMISKEITWLDY